MVWKTISKLVIHMLCCLVACKFDDDFIPNIHCDFNVSSECSSKPEDNSLVITALTV